MYEVLRLRSRLGMLRDRRCSRTPLVIWKSGGFIYTITLSYMYNDDEMFETCRSLRTYRVRGRHSAAGMQSAPRSPHLDRAQDIEVEDAAPVVGRLDEASLRLE